MSTPLDTILSGGSDAAPEQQTAETVTQAPAEDQTTDDLGRPTEGQTTEGEGGQRVPVAALQAERQKVKRYTEEVADFRKQLADSEAAHQRRMAELMEVLKPKQEAPPPPDFFENPQAATRHEVSQATGAQFDGITQTLQAFARDNAVTRYDEATVNEAEQAFFTALKSNRLDPADYQRVAGSHNRFAAAVQWHKSQQAKAEIGDDPAAYKAKVEAEIRARLEAENNGGNGQQQAQPARTMPSNFQNARNVGTRSTGPAWAGPQDLNSIFATRR